MDAQGPGSPYQQTLQQEPRTNAATPTPRTISTSFHLSSRTISTPPPTTHPPLSYGCMRVHTYTHVRCIFSTSLFLVANPTLHCLHHRHLIKPQNTHNYVDTHTLAHTHTRASLPSPTLCSPEQAATRNGGVL